MPCTITHVRTHDQIGDQRADAYPSLSDLADAIYWERRGDSSKIAAYLARCDAVKARYPKPKRPNKPGHIVKKAGE